METAAGWQTDYVMEFPGERTNNFAFSPDEKKLVVARSNPTQDIVAITDVRQTLLRDRLFRQADPPQQRFVTRIGF